MGLLVILVVDRQYRTGNSSPGDFRTHRVITEIIQKRIPYPDVRNHNPGMPGLIVPQYPERSHYRRTPGIDNPVIHIIGGEFLPLQFPVMFIQFTGKYRQQFIFRLRECSGNTYYSKDTI